jgi:hypothetical protein
VADEAKKADAVFHLSPFTLSSRCIGKPEACKREISVEDDSSFSPNNVFIRQIVQNVDDDRVYA